ncbi:MAG: acetyl-CoA C-acetyltransferase, partial [Pseudobdellovibrionaceae bacterium]
METVVIASCARTPIGSFQGTLSSVPGPRLGATAIDAALKKINLEGKYVDEFIIGE